jgi:hypothetical protein
MGPIIQGVVIGFIPLGLLQTAALVYFAGRLTKTVEDHDLAIKKWGERCEYCNRVVAIVANKEGIAL